MSSEYALIHTDRTTEELLKEEQDRAELDRTWSRPRGLLGWLMTVNHKEISKRYVITAFCFFLLGGVEAALMRLQLSRPENPFIGPDLYNQLFTMHGSTMMFLFAVPVMEAIGLYLIPLMIGTRNVAFPRMNAFGYFTYLIGGLLLYAAFFLRFGADTGWFSYVTLAGPEFAPGKRVDVWAQMITFTELAALVGAVEIIVTVFKLRAPGMSLNRIPLFVWAMVVTSFMIIFAMPAIMIASSYLAMDRLVATHFFNPAEGGDALMWQHLFWFFGHPEVYIIFIPATGFVSTIVSSFSRRPIFGYTAMVLSLVSTGFIGFGLWVHHMFTVGLPQLGGSFFTASSIMIAIPSGIQVSCWIATLWGGRPRFRTPLVFVMGFVAVFVIGGLTGVMLAAIPLDTQVHDTFFVVAHLHYVLIGGAIFPLFGALYFWLPKATGRMLSERLGHLNFWTMFVGFNLTFFPMHQLGLNGMPRRIYTYLPDTGWERLNLIATVGAAVMALSVLMFLINVLWSQRRGRMAGDDPWGASTLEWATTSPPPSYNFTYLPIAQGRDPLWSSTEYQPVVIGLRTDHREVLTTNVLDAEPDHIYQLPWSSIWPIALAIAVGVTFIAVIFTPWGLPIGAILALIALVGWFWEGERHKSDWYGERQ
jgi:cytochrome c oxidase subunit I+III